MLFDFWRFLRLPEENFIQMADTGDLLIGILMQKKIGKTTPIFMILFVNVIIKVQNNDRTDIYILQSNKKHEVLFETWYEFKNKKDKNYTDIWYRHLYVNRDEFFI
jgi:hypothetical protein